MDSSSVFDTYATRLSAQPLILKLTPILDLFGARRLSQQSHPFFPELRKGAYPVYTDTGAALFTEVRGSGILRSSPKGFLQSSDSLGSLPRSV
jgi:hypothetical protein